MSDRPPITSQKRRVVHVVWRGGFGGMTRALFQLIRAQRDLGDYEPALIVGSGESDYFEELRAEGIAVHQMGLRSDRNVLAAPALARTFREYPVHHFHAAEVTLVIASLLARGAARVFTYRSGGGPDEGVRRLRYAFARWYIQSRFHGYAGNTEHACRAGSEKFGVSVDRWVPVHNGLDFSMHEPRRDRRQVRAELGADDSTFVIGTAADLRDWKRIERLIDAVALLNTRDARLVILGDGPARDGLEQHARRLGLEDRTVFTGLKRGIADYLHALDAFALPSNHRESFGNAAVEAMYQRLPVIVFDDGGGLLEHVTDAVTGYVVGSVEQLAGRLGELMIDPARGAVLGQAARELVTTRYTIPRMVNAYNELYRAAEKRAGHD